MPYLGIGFHVIVAIYFAVHAVRTGRPIYWLFILFSFPLLGSLVYFLVEFLPETRLNRDVGMAARTIAKSLNPGRELREARRAFDLYRRVLRAELGVEPGRPLRDRHTEMRRRSAPTCPRNRQLRLGVEGVEQPIDREPRGQAQGPDLAVRRRRRVHHRRHLRPAALSRSLGESIRSVMTIAGSR